MASQTTIPPFTLAGFRAGLAASLVLVPGVALYGLAFGVMAAARGLTGPEAVLFSAWLNAGGAQMATLAVWTDPLPWAAIGLTTVAMNARYLLLGAALRPWFGPLPAAQAYPSLFVLGDGNWALALREHAAGRTDAAFLAGSGTALWLSWTAATALGHLGGQVIGDPQRFGIDFMLPAFFATMALAFFRRAGGIAPLIAGIGVAVIVDRLVPGPWYILSGALAGSLAGALRRADPA
ncbi:MAG: AzlC family ABC transporter permease [Ferrovibrionaceae bacterium]